jgi:hypothetical protein
MRNDKWKMENVSLFLTSLQLDQGPKRPWYSAELMKAFTISAFTKLPLNWLSLVSQKS